MMKRSLPPTSTARRGLALAEVAISSFLVGVLLVASLRTVESSLVTWQGAAETADGHALAKDLLDEVLSQAYEEPVDTPVFGPEPGEDSETGADRSMFDDIDEYHGWAQSPPVMPNGVTIPNHTGWTRSATVEKLSAANRVVIPNSSADEGLRQVTVVTTSPDGDTTTLIAWRSASGGMQETLAVDQTVVTWVGCELQAGPDDPVMRVGTLVSNHAEDN